MTVLVDRRMDELGHILREARETKGFTLDDVQQQTRINSRFLAALENGEYETLPTPVHVRGFLRNYARFLGLDPRPLLDRYELNQRNSRSRRGSAIIQQDNQSELSTGPLQLRSDQPFFEPVNMEVNVSGRQNTEAILRLLIIGALLVSLYLVANRFVPRLFGGGDGTEALTQSISEAWQSLISGDEETAAMGLEDEFELRPSSVISPTSRNDFGLPPADDDGAAAPTRPSLPATMEVIRLRVDVTERTFMEVTIDGDIVFTGHARQDDSFEWEAREEAKILTGNAIGLVVTINDIPLGRLGGRGEAREEVWRTTN